MTIKDTLIDALVASTPDPQNQEAYDGVSGWTADQEEAAISIVEVFDLLEGMDIASEFDEKYTIVPPPGSILSELMKSGDWFCPGCGLKMKQRHLAADPEQPGVGLCPKCKTKVESYQGEGTPFENLEMFICGLHDQIKDFDIIHLNSYLREVARQLKEAEITEFKLRRAFNMAASSRNRCFVRMEKAETKMDLVRVEIDGWDKALRDDPRIKKLEKVLKDGPSLE